MIQGVLNGTPRFELKSDGSFAFLGSGGGRGHLPEDTVDRIACKIASYDFSVLWANPEPRRVLCPERVAHADSPIGRHYSGMTLDVRMNGEEWRIRVGWCPEPLNLREAVDTVKLEAARSIDGE